MKKKASRPGYTMVEIIIVIAIIGILATLAAVSLKKVSGRAKDSKRLSDISMMRRALEIYKFAQGNYPDAISMYNGRQLIIPKDNSVLIMSIPSNPSSNNPSCLYSNPGDLRYAYNLDTVNDTYYIYFCLDAKIDSIGPGDCVATVRSTCEKP